MIWFFITILFYLLSPPIIFLLLRVIREQKARKMPRKFVKDAPVTLTFREKVQKWIAFLSLSFNKRRKREYYAARIVMPFILVLLFGILFKKWWLAIVIAIPTPFILFFVLSLLIRESYTEYERMLEGFLVFKTMKLGLVDKTSNKYTTHKEFTLADFDEKTHKPKKIVFHLPPAYNQEQETRILEEWNKAFNYNGIWKPAQDAYDEKKGTWTLVWSTFFTKEIRDYLNSMVVYKKKVMGYADPNSGLFTYYKEFEVLEWDRDDQKPSKIRLYLPIGFASYRQFSFLDDFSDQFGRTRPWEVDNEDRDFPGWDADKRVATLKLLAALPKMAPYHEKYVLDKNVAWSYFPIGIGSRGGIPWYDEKRQLDVRLVGYDVNGNQSDICEKNGWSVGADLMAAPHAIMAGVTGGGKSILQNTVVLNCLLRPEKWLLFIIDLKRVEAAKWRKFGVPIAITLEEASNLLKGLMAVMNQRYEIMSARELTDWEQMPEAERGPAIMIDIDEVVALLSPKKGNSDEEKLMAQQVSECQSSMEAIAQLGRAAQVYMFTAGQRPSADVVSMQIRQNSPIRIAAGHLPGTISGMVFEDNSGTKIEGSPKGRIGIRVHSAPFSKAQGFFVKPADEWLMNYLKRNNKPLQIYHDAKADVGIQDSELGFEKIDENGMLESEFDELEQVL